MKIINKEKKKKYIYKIKEIKKDLIKCCFVVFMVLKRL